MNKTYPFTNIVYVDILQQDIDVAGKSSQDCPVARALRRQYPEMGTPVVYAQRIRFIKSDRGYWNEYYKAVYKPDMMTTQKINAYDSGMGMRPFRMEMVREV